MIRNLIDIPIVYSAGLLQRMIGSEEERASQVWEERLQIRDFFCGVVLLAAVAVAVFGILAWASSSTIETKYAVRAAAEMNDRRYPQAVVSYQRLVGMHPADRRYRYSLLLAYAGAGELDRAAGLMTSLAPERRHRLSAGSTVGRGADVGRPEARRRSPAATRDRSEACPSASRARRGAASDRSAERDFISLPVDRRSSSTTRP